VTPDDRHFGREQEVLARRRATYEKARQLHPERWSGAIRDWSPVGDVYLNPNTGELSLEEIVG
jgi:putative transposase